MMKEGDVILTPVPQADGTIKTRPAVILREMPPYKDFLVSTQLHQVKMNKTIEAIFDGKVLRPKDALTLEPNTRVRITIEPVEPMIKGAVSFLDTALSLKLDGPND